MNKKHFFALYSLLPVWMLYTQVYMLLYYWGVLLLIAIYMYTRPQLKARSNTALHIFMLLYVTFITWERTRHYKFAPMPELIINDAEHILFALLICFIIFSLLALKQTAWLTFTKRLIITVIIFNLAGLLNEFFQNIIGSRPMFVLIADSTKDIIMNVYGTALFAGDTLLLKHHKQVIMPALAN